MELTTEAIDIARARGQTGYETYARLAFARVLLASQGAETQEIETALLATLELAIEREAIAFKPLVHGELAELA